MNGIVRAMSSRIVRKPGKLFGHRQTMVDHKFGEPEDFGVGVERQAASNAEFGDSVDRGPGEQRKLRLRTVQLDLNNLPGTQGRARIDFEIDVAVTPSTSLSKAFQRRQTKWMPSRPQMPEQH
jgi:hypothetical protein